jgi:hypothetical protein
VLENLDDKVDAEMSKRGATDRRINTKLGNERWRLSRGEKQRLSGGLQCRRKMNYRGERQ